MLYTHVAVDLLIIMKPQGEILHPEDLICCRFLDHARTCVLFVLNMRNRQVVAVFIPILTITLCV